MIQDYSGLFVGKQSVRVRAVPIRGNAIAKKVVGAVLAGVLAMGIVASITFCMLIRAGLQELAAQNNEKLGIMKEQQALYAQRNGLIDQKSLAQSAGRLGLYPPEGRQLRRL